MSANHIKRERVEQALREAFLRQPAPTPGETWYRSVMQEVRQDPVPRIIPFPFVERTAWRVASVAAAVAVIIVTRAFLSTPRVAPLAWDIESNRSTYEWFLTSRE